MEDEILYRMLDSYFPAIILDQNFNYLISHSLENYPRFIEQQFKMRKHAKIVSIISVKTAPVLPPNVASLKQHL